MINRKCGDRHRSELCRKTRYRGRVAKGLGGSGLSHVIRYLFKSLQFHLSNSTITSPLLAALFMFSATSYRTLKVNANALCEFRSIIHTTNRASHYFSSFQGKPSNHHKTVRSLLLTHPVRAQTKAADFWRILSIRLIERPVLSHIKGRILSMDEWNFKQNPC